MKNLFILLATALSCTASFACDVGNRFQYANGEVTDTQSGLIWRACALGETFDNSKKICTGDATVFITWQDAMAAAKADKTNGQNWRLPNVKELATLLIDDAFCSDFALNYIAPMESQTLDKVKYDESVEKEKKDSNGKPDHKKYIKEYQKVKIDRFNKTYVVYIQDEGTDSEVATGKSVGYIEGFYTSTPDNMAAGNVFAYSRTNSTGVRLAPKGMTEPTEHGVKNNAILVRSQ